MKSWKRIILVVFVLIGSVGFFSYWSFNQFNKAFDDIGASNVATALANYSSFKKDVEIASTSPEVLETLASTTNLALYFTFPQKGDEIYIDCTYQLSWQSSTTIKSLGVALIDAGTREPAGPIASGLAKENNIEKDSQNLKWKVGNIWPGEYYIKVSKINGIDTEIKSKIFTISNTQENICDN